MTYDEIASKRGIGAGGWGDDQPINSEAVESVRDFLRNVPKERQGPPAYPCYGIAKTVSELDGIDVGEGDVLVAAAANGLSIGRASRFVRRPGVIGIRSRFFWDYEFLEKIGDRRTIKAKREWDEETRRRQS